VHATVFKENAENERNLAKILPYTPHEGVPMHLLGASHLFLGLHPC